MGSFVGCEELLGRAVAQRAVGVSRVVGVQPPVRLELPLGQRVKPLRVEEFAANTVVERLDERILRRFTGLDEEQLDVMLFRPELHQLGRELRPVVDAQVLRIAVDRGNTVQHGDYRSAWKRE